jgi:signal transduction histidine kinase
MIGTAVLALVAAYFLVGTVQRSRERAADERKAALTAQAIAHTAAGGETAEFYRAVQSVLTVDRISVYRGGRLIFGSPVVPGRQSEVTATRSFPGGRVVLSVQELASSASLDVILLAAPMIALVIASGIFATSILTRQLRGGIETAANAARRVAGGDLSARIGEVSEDEFEDLARAFDGMAMRLQELDEEQRRFLGDVAHEIATPINAISGFALALADGNASSQHEREAAGAVIASESERLAHLLEDLRRLTRLDLAQATREEHVDVRALCDQVVARFEPVAEENGVLVRVDAPRLEIVTDHRLLDTILQNLVSNAIRYTPSGGRVELLARRKRTVLTLSVRDTGIGIALEHQARVFDRLYRVDEARDRVSGGLGLGLTLAQRAAHALGGRIVVTSNPGVGSEFQLVIPLSGRSAVRDLQESAAERPGPASEAPENPRSSGASSERADVSL